MAKATAFPTDFEMSEVTSLDVSRKNGIEVFEQQASLVVLTGSRAGRTHPVKDAVVLGRETDCTLRVDGSKISRHHARIERAESGYVLTDLNSRNGTRINGVPTKCHALNFGDRISLGGDCLLLFTQQDKLQDQLLHQQRMESIGRLAGGIAHDFNNLLGALLGNATVLTELEPDIPLGDATVQEVISDITMAGKQAAELTQQLLGFARRGKYEERPIDVSELLEEVVRLCRRTFDRAIAIEMRVEPDVVVIGDRAQLHQLFMNVLINARDAMPEGGTITIGAENTDGPSRFIKRGGAASVISIRDTGEGMSDDIRAKVFEPFFTTKELGRGTGLGLATAYGIVQSHGGDIRVHSKVGEGTEFEIHLPGQAKLPRRTRPVRQNVYALRRASAAKKGVVLLVDDERLYVRSSKRLLERAGYEVLVANDGRQAVEVYRKNQSRVQLVLLDLMMPGMGGEETCAELRKLNPKVDVLAMSGYSEEEKARDIIAAGARGFLRKPFEWSALQAAMNDIISGQRRGPATRNSAAPGGS